MSEKTLMCGRCGEYRPRFEQALIDDSAYCHGDDTPSCYEYAQWDGLDVFRIVDDIIGRKERRE